MIAEFSVNQRHRVRILYASSVPISGTEPKPPAARGLQPVSIRGTGLRQIHGTQCQSEAQRADMVTHICVNQRHRFRIRLVSSVSISGTELEPFGRKGSAARVNQRQGAKTRSWDSVSIRGTEFRHDRPHLCQSEAQRPDPRNELRVRWRTRARASRSSDPGAQKESSRNRFGVEHAELQNSN